MLRSVRIIRNLALLVVILFGSINARATHIYGADLYYTHVSGLTYDVTLVVYGDCGGSAFSTLTNATASVTVLNGSSPYTNLTLLPQSPVNGTEVTPVCASQINNTNCNSGSIPGVKKFVYKRSVTLNTTSANWKFRWIGSMSSSSAGRSNSITNISSGTTTTLEATLNNTNAPNSSPTYTTIPTPFFCINKAANYNPGTVDADNDALSYSLVPGLTSTGTVTYQTGYSATNPLAYTAGTFSFSSTTGQLSFTPNLVQRSLVVNRVEEYRNGVLVGTSMREMTFVVLNNCNNNPPTGFISNNSGGTLINGNTEVVACQSVGTLTFNVSPTDLDNDNITITANGVPVGSTFSVTSNNTTAPTGTFSWNLTNVPAGSYTFFLTFLDNGCPLSSKQTQAYTVTVLPNPTVSLTIDTPASCVAKARITLTPSIAPSPWEVKVLQGSTTLHTFSSITGAQKDSLAPGTYTIRVKNTNNCTKDTTIVIDPPPAIVPSIAVTKPTCVGGNDGKITVSISGGKAPFQYALGTGSYGSSNTFTGLSMGSYTIYIKDANECQKDTLVFVQNPPDIVAQITFKQPPCNYYNSGVITVNAVNGTAPYEYALNTGAFSSTNTYTGLYSGTYTIHIKDDNGCTKDSVFLLPDSVKVHATPTLTHILCNGDNTGAITLNAFGAASPYVYQLGSGTLGSTNTFTNLTAGNYVFHIEDVNKCYLDTTITLNQPTPITSSETITNVLCYGNATGAFTTAGSGGVSPYTYAIGAGSYGNSGTFNTLTAGTYTLHVKDDNGCIKDKNIIITEPTELVINGLTVSKPLCNGNANGSIGINAGGGVTPYDYSINGGVYQGSNTFSTLGAGTYTLRVRDDNGCTKDSTYDLQQPDPIVPTALVKNSACSPLSDGAVTLSATGGTPAYQYAYDANAYQASPVISPLAKGTYVFHIKDFNNCIKDTTITIIDSIVVTANINISDALCFDSSSGAIAVTPGGGTSPYIFALDAGGYQSSSSFSNLHANLYVLHIKDKYGCILDTNITVDQPQKFNLFTSITQPACFGFTNGVITVNISGGTPAYNFAINNNPYQTGNALTGLKAGTYLVKIKDKNGCYIDTTVTMGEPAKLELNTTISPVTCHGDSSGSVQITGTGGTPTYTYRKNNDPFTNNATISNLPKGSYIISILDNNNCQKDTLIDINEPDKLILSGLDLLTPTCESFADGQISAQGDGGVSPYQYALNSGAYQGSGTFGSIAAGMYTVSVKDANNCVYDTTVELTGYPPIIIQDLDITNASCNAFSDGIIIVNATGGIQPLQYKIGVQSASPNNTFNGLNVGQYIITVIDDKNCEKDTVLNITEPEVLHVSTTVTPNDCEGYDDGGKASATSIGGTEPYKYTWSTNPPRTGDVAAGLPNGKYIVFVEDDNGCKDSTSAIIIYNNCCKVFIPDAFTPNGDGKNEFAKILVKGDLKLEIFNIYNRFGQLVFTTTDLTKGWDGIYNGVPQDMGTYNYYVKGICGNAGNEEVQFKGTVTLIR